MNNSATAYTIPSLLYDNNKKAIYNVIKHNYNVEVKDDILPVGITNNFDYIDFNSYNRFL